jgi:hypothetical protein
MPYALIVIGIAMIIAGARNTYQQLGTQLVADFRGFVWWLLAILIVGALGYVPAFKPVTRAFLVLILIVMVLRNGGFAQQFLTALQKGPQQIASAPDAAAQASASSGGAASNNPLGSVSSAASSASSIDSFIASSFALFGL